VKKLKQLLGDMCISTLDKNDGQVLKLLFK
jgi:hypothetical protein